MRKTLSAFLTFGLSFWSCEDNKEIQPTTIILNPTTYEGGKILISWIMYNKSDFLNYDLYTFQNDSLNEGQLIASFGNPKITSFTQNETYLQLNERKFYQLHLITSDNTFKSNITSSHNWHIYNDIMMANMIDYTIQNISEEEHPYYRNVPFSIEELEELIPVDSIGIPYYSKDGQIYDHPVRHAQMALHLLNSHSFETENLIFLNRAKLVLDRLLEIADEDGNSLFFAYPFDFSLHSAILNDDEMMLAPWYSGMAQGQALSAFSKYFSASEDSLYLHSAEKIFISFLKIMQDGDPWFTGIDGDNYLWLEEYPDSEQPNKTLNGMIFAIYGLYDYYRITENEDCLNLLKMAITTIQNYILHFRVEGDQSYYCLTHQVQHPRYHRIHTTQLGKLYLITGEQYFLNMQQLFELDYSEGFHFYSIQADAFRQTKKMVLLK